MAGTRETQPRVPVPGVPPADKSSPDNTNENKASRKAGELKMTTECASSATGVSTDNVMKTFIATAAVLLVYSICLPHRRPLTPRSDMHQ